MSSRLCTFLDVDMQMLLKETQELARRETLKNTNEWLDAAVSDRQFEECLESRLERTCEWIFQHSMFKA